MKIQPGDLLIANDGNFYRVLECSEEMISLTRVNGYTFFSCKTEFVKSTFRTLQPSTV
ncbi:hypothetical protein ACN4EK_30815 [Pantanalinema rosaneae CENA516]|uniref:hypothetical protein n=1 Tax=Pantanalinema rosaneae TaxID=1620701 RepID=UPI003D6EA258